MLALSRRTLQTALTALFLLGVSAAAVAESVRVTVDRATLWANPTGTGGVVGIVGRGEVLEVDKREGRWILVVFPADPRRKGYILEQQVEPAPDSASSPAARDRAKTPAQRPAAARPRRPRRPSFFYVGLTGQATALDFTVTETTTTLLETETRTTDYTPSRIPGFEFTFGHEVSRRFIVSAGVVRMAGTGTASMQAQIPHPILYNSPRELLAEADSTRSETALHVRLDYLLYRSPRYQMTAGLGPSFFFVNQELIDQVSYGETYPFDSVTLESVTMKKRSATGAGAHAEFDITGRISRRAAWQATVRYAYGSPKFDLTNADGKTNAGGGHVGGGLRFVF